MTPDEVVRFAESLAQIVAGGGGPSALAEHLAGAIGASVLVEDPAWQGLAAAGSSPLPTSARGPAEGVARVAICAGERQLGWLSVLGADDAHRALLRLTAAALALELLRDGAVRRSPTAFWERLLAGEYRDATAARDDATASGVALAGAYLVVALEVEPAEGSTEIAPGELRRLAAEAFRNVGPGFVERGTMLLALIPAAREIDRSNARTAAILLPKAAAKRAAPLRLSGGVGTVRPLLDLTRGAEQAQAALAIGRRVHGAGRVCAYEELGAYPLLYEGSDIARLRAFAAHTLAPLRAYDEKHQTELLRTLRLYFEVGQNVKTAAAQLFVHRHTVFYRLRQIAEIAGISLDSPLDQLSLRTAVAIDALHT